jgi:hypothetical protein
MSRKPTLAGILMHGQPRGVVAGELSVALAGSEFHRDALGDRANRDVVLQAIKRHIPGVDRFTIVGASNGGGNVTDHPAVQAAITEFQGEVVAVRPRTPEGEGE